MALSQDGRIAVFRTVGEAFGLTWTHRLPYLLLICMTLFPMLSLPLLGYFDSLQEVARMTERGDPAAAMEQLRDFQPLVLFVSIITVLLFYVFAILWFRYLLLGREGALKLGFATFNRIFWAFSLRAFAVSLVAGLLAILIMIGTMLLVSLMGLLLGPLGSALGIVPMMASYILPLAFLVRLAPALAAVAVDETYGFSRSWSTTHGSAWRMTGGILMVYVPFLIVGMMIQAGLLLVLHFQVLDPEDPTALFAYLDYIWIVFLLVAPVFYLPVAVSLAIAAIAYRDLGDGPATAEESDLSYAH